VTSIGNTPYVTPGILLTAPTGISWSTIPQRGASEADRIAELTNICWRATHSVDSRCNQTLRATITQERLTGPDYRVTIGPGGVARVVPSRAFIQQVLSLGVCPASRFPRVFTQVPDGSFDVDQSILGDTAVAGAAGVGAYAIVIAPGWISWMCGRNGYLLDLQYVDGFPHASLTASAATGANQLQVDDVTGMAGAVVAVLDGGNTEQGLVVTAATQASGTLVQGPGTITLAGTLAFGHPAGTVVSALPMDVQKAAIKYAVAEALTRGATATTVQSVSGSNQQGGATSGKTLTEEADKILAPYRRVV
jgi:hypothetical protein